MCLVILAVMTLFFIGVGGYYIATKSDYEPQNQSTDDTQIFFEHKGPIITCIFLSILVSFIYIFLLKVMPRGMVLTMIFVSLGLIALLCIIGLATSNYALAITMGIMLIVYGIVLACFRNQIKTGIVLVKVATKFMA